MKITITQKVSDEQAVLKCLLLHAIFTLPNIPRPNAAIIEKPELIKYVRDWGQENDHAVYAIMGAKVLGACWVRCFPESSPGYGTISAEIPELSIAVIPGYRGKGIGSQLLSSLISLIKTNYRAVSLSVSKDNPAKSLYDRFGFKIVNQTQDAFVMKKDLQLSED